MTDEDNKKQIINFAIEELKKVFDDVQKGNTPKTLRDLKKLQQVLTEVDKKVKSNTLSEEDANKIAQDIINKMLNKGK